MKIYLIEGNTGKIHIATRLYIHDGSHGDVINIGLEGYTSIKDKLIKGEYFVDSRGSSWYLRNNGITNEVYFKNGIKNIKEKILRSFDDVYDICSHPNVCSMDKVRLMEKWFNTMK